MTGDLLRKEALMLPSYYHPYMPFVLPHTGDPLFGPAWPCLLPVPEPSVGPAKHKASLIPATSSLLLQEIAQDNFTSHLAFGAPGQRPPGFEGPAGAGLGPLSHPLGPLPQSQGERGNSHPGLSRREGKGGDRVSGCHTPSCWE